MDCFKYKGKTYSRDELITELSVVDTAIVNNITSIGLSEVSKVVDSNGEPLVVYHGASDKFDTFDLSKGKNTSGLREVAHFFTTNTKVAKMYEQKGDGKGVIQSVFLNIKSPLTFDGQGLDMRGWENIELPLGYKIARGKADVMDALVGKNSVYKNTIYDGVIGDNIAEFSYGSFDNNDVKEAAKPLLGQVFAVWNSNQIKSATENSGAFDPNNPNIKLQAKPDAKEIALNNIRTSEKIRNNSTPEQLFEAFEERFRLIGVTLKDIQDVYNEIPPKSKEPLGFDTQDQGTGIPPKPTKVVEPSKTEAASFDDVQVLKSSEVKDAFLSKKTLIDLDTPFNEKDFTPNDIEDFTQLRFEIANVVITGEEYVGKAIQMYGPDPNVWVPKLVGYANTADILKRNIILTHLMDKLRYGIQVEPALIRFVDVEWRKAGSITSEAFNSRRALRKLQELRAGNLIDDSGIMTKNQKLDAETLQRKLDEADDAELAKYEEEMRAEPLEKVKEEVYVPTPSKQVRGKAKSQVTAKKGQDKKALIAQINKELSEIDCPPTAR